MLEHSPTIWIAYTLGIYLAAKYIYAKTRWLILHPVLISIVGIIITLKTLGIDYHSYSQGGDIIAFFLGPSVVALGVLLHQKFEIIKKNILVILLSVIAGGIAGIVSVTYIAWLLKASDIIILSLAPKSVTTPIAIEIVRITGGLESLTAAVVILVGIFGAAVGPIILRILKINEPIAFGLAMGTASHGIGTARALEEGEMVGAASGLGMCINGIATALFTQWIMNVFFKIL